ncbi:MAG: hypothetical protein WDW38_008964 [Sanguina aurantia]
MRPEEGKARAGSSTPSPLAWSQPAAVPFEWVCRSAPPLMASTLARERPYTGERGQHCCWRLGDTDTDTEVSLTLEELRAGLDPDMYILSRSRSQAAAAWYWE